jgi:hypothetical protein
MKKRVYFPDSPPYPAGDGITLSTAPLLFSDRTIVGAAD